MSLLKDALLTNAQPLTSKNFRSGQKGDFGRAETTYLSTTSSVQAAAQSYINNNPSRYSRKVSNLPPMGPTIK